MISAILHQPDWQALRQSPTREAAEALAGLLARLDGADKNIFALRGMAMLLIEERELWREFIDPEVDLPYASFDRWIKATCPESWGYCRDALRAVKELRDVPFADLLQMPRCNMHQLTRVSGQIRILPEVVQAAKTMPEKSFVAKMNREHSQHLEVKQPLVMADPMVGIYFEKAIALACDLYGLTSRGAAIEAVAQDFILAHQDMISEGA
jgi:hypothetical protein